MSLEEMKEAALRALMLGLGRDGAVRRVSRVNAAGTLLEAEARDGDLFRLELKVVGVGRRTGGTGAKTT